MALVKEILTQKTQVFADQKSPLFEGFPLSIKENAEKWADAIDSYASLVIPVSTTNTIAKKALYDLLSTVISEPLFTLAFE